MVLQLDLALLSCILPSLMNMFYQEILPWFYKDIQAELDGILR